MLHGAVARPPAGRTGSSRPADKRGRCRRPRAPSAATVPVRREDQYEERKTRSSVDDNAISHRHECPGVPSARQTGIDGSAQWTCDARRKRASGALPAQALQSFRRSSKLATASPDIYAQIEALERAFPILPLTPAVVLEAVRGVRDHGMSY
jgi:hypothetical protein